MMKKHKSLLLKFINILLISCSLYSWTIRTHIHIGEIVYSSLPPEYQDLLDKSEFISGCTAPDKKAYKNIFKWRHVYHPRSGFGDLPVGCEELYKQSLSLLKAGKKKQGSFLLGGLVHYISDIAVPLHTDEASWETDDLHNEIEKEAEDIVLAIRHQAQQTKFSNIHSFVVSIANDANRKYDKLLDKGRRTEVMKEQFFVACDASYSVVFDILFQIMPLRQYTETSAAGVSPVTAVDISQRAPDAEAELKERPVVQSVQSENRPQSSPVGYKKTQSKPPKTVRMMGIILSPDKEYRLKLVPDGSGNFYLDIWESE